MLEMSTVTSTPTASVTLAGVNEKSSRATEAEVGERLRGVCREDQGDLVPTDVDIGMVIGLLGGEGNPVDEAHRLGEVGELEGLRDLLTFDRPRRMSVGQGLLLCWGEWGRHATSVV